jgi:hypothetical protein
MITKTNYITLWQQHQTTNLKSVQVILNTY